MFCILYYSTFDYFVRHTHQTESHFCLYSLNVRLSALLFALWEGPVEIAYSQYQLAAAEPQHEQHVSIDAYIQL
jgi:hypothetical protein